MMMPRDDRFSELPDPLITQILLHLPTKDSVKTSVLSTRWKNLWLHVPGLDLNCCDFPFKNQNELEMVTFIDRFLQFNPDSRLLKFKVDYSRDQIPQFEDRIGDAVSRGVRVLDVKSNTLYQDADDGLVYPCIEFMPLNLYTSKTLVSLKLLCSGLWEPEGLVYMPCLRFMHLQGLRWRSSGSGGSTMNLERLVSGCPVLEELTYVKDINDDESVVTRVRSRSLKRFTAPVEYGCYGNLGVVQTFEIDAPGLEYMSLKEDHFDRIVVKNLTSLFMVDLHIKFIVESGRMFDSEDLSKRNEVCDFLTGISSVRHMTISHQTVKVLGLYSKVGVIPKFNNLSRLHAVFPSSFIQFLPVFLESLPNLKHLILEIPYVKEKTEEFKLVNVPQCLVSALEFLEVKRLFDWGKEEMKTASYFLENSAVLKKLTLRFMGCPQYYSDTDIYEELNNLTKCSPTCQIIIA
ncbi:PREDICTED: F-box/FBD/LRR-repeat protein At1g13780-like [Camelina sativa]|uniref:F-box/FBD/LRR-repeat protein At1g13780-like n=1 Tax=Camelina sativa TaxID=90675 RepID=A0ABM0VNH5_CAMSA|nr:PREDICTED: F-box/FBD/LRR-repeat protein At1g13780-like [Camelina sativa]XP_010458841.1 PREDICTED: F-box/FBD/LRR-repeat protein At1g13780-like [Camelina sativa]